MAVDVTEMTMQDWETAEVERANSSGKRPVVFVHGLWLLPSSWDRWGELFEEAGYVPVKPGWPDDPQTVADAKANPEVFANKSVGQIADHLEAVISRLDQKPAIIGHSFGGLLTQILAGARPSPGAGGARRRPLPPPPATSALGASRRKGRGRQPAQLPPRGTPDLR